jgi:hypothetical protein
LIAAFLTVQVAHPVAGDTDMPKSTYYFQECPTCGRTLQVRVEYLGKKVVCQHCQGRFEAADPESAAYPPTASGLAMMQKADELLNTVSQRRTFPK